MSTSASTPDPDSPAESAAETAEKTVQRKQAGLLVLLGVIGVAAVMPFAFALQQEKLAEVTKKTGASLLSLAMVSCAQSSVFVLISVFAGLFAARRLGLGAPVTLAMARGEPAWPVLRRLLGGAVLWGLVSGGLTVFLDGAVFNPRVPELRALNETALAHHSVWKAALACLYGGFTEEIIVRLFILSLIALGLVHLGQALGLSKRAGMQPREHFAALLTANVLAALLFGLMHLPATAAMVKLTPLLVVRALVLNGVVGLACGFLYVGRGLEAAMVAHLTADVVLHLVAPALLQAGVIHL